MEPPIDRPDLAEQPVPRARYTLVDGPHHEIAPEGTLLTGYYRAVFERGDGERIERFLTDAGRAEVLRRRGEDDPTFDGEEFEDWTVVPDVTALLARYTAEAGVGG